MSYVFIRYDDNSYEYFEEVKTSWGDDGSLMLVDINDPKEYSWIHIGKVVKVEVSEYPHPELETIEEEDSEQD